MSIKVEFGGQELPSVVGVQLGSDLSDEAIISASAIGHRTRNVVVRGFVRRPVKTDMLALQQSTEETFAAIGPSTLDFPGVAPFTARLLSWQWDEWNNGPIIRYQATFSSEEANPFSGDVTIAQTKPTGTQKTLAPRPSVANAFRNPSTIDEKIDVSKNKTIALAGRLEGAPADVENEIEEIRDLLTGDSVFSVTLATGVYSCKAGEITFNVPAGPDEGPTTYQINLETLPDFTLEDRALHGGPINLAGITLDVATSFSRSITRDVAGKIESETINASGKKFGLSMSEVENFKDTVDALVLNGATLTSPTGLVLRAASANWSEPTRDGHDTAGNRRYSVSVSLSFSPTTPDDVAGQLRGTHLGVVFDLLDSVSYSVSFGGDGTINSRTKNASGRVILVPAIRPGDNVTDEGREYWITSLNLGNVDGASRRQVSIAGQTLDTAAAAEKLFPDFFKGFFLDHVQSRSKSVSYQEDSCTGTYKATSVSESVSGFKLGSNGGVLNLIQTIERLAGNFIITSVSTGAPEIKRVGETLQERYPISISGTLNLDSGAGQCTIEPAIKDETTRSIEDATTKYAQITIPGKGVVFKKIGLNPSTEEVTIKRVSRNRSIHVGAGFPADPSPTIEGAQRIGRATQESGLTRTVKVKFQAFTGAIEA